ncbi:MAG: hypothetical protein JXB38_17740 [Anaerolineales bacterium]|nr:hypothetical protein [Anaerolineales bacterium]
MKPSQKEIIFIQLLDEGTTVYRPTYGEVIAENIFRVLQTENYDPKDEIWEFLPGMVVQCKMKKLTGGEDGLVAIAEYNMRDV